MAGDLSAPGATRGNRFQACLGPVWSWGGLPASPRDKRRKEEVDLTDKGELFASSSKRKLTQQKDFLFFSPSQKALTLRVHPASSHAIKRGKKHLFCTDSPHAVGISLNLMWISQFIRSYYIFVLHKSLFEDECKPHMHGIHQHNVVGSWLTLLCFSRRRRRGGQEASSPTFDLSALLSVPPLSLFPWLSGFAFMTATVLASSLVVEGKNKRKGETLIPSFSLFWHSCYNHGGFWGG